MGVSKMENGWFIMENPMNKWMIWGVLPPLFLVQHPYTDFKSKHDNFNNMKASMAPLLQLGIPNFNAGGATHLDPGPANRGVLQTHR